MIIIPEFISGIYCLECLINKKKYIGSAQNIYGRKIEHFRLLRKGINNRLIQEDYNKYGKDNFQFIIIEEIENNDEFLIEKENYYMDYFKTYVHEYGYKFGYNLARASRNRPDEESNKKRSNSLKGKNIALRFEQCLEIKNLILQEKQNNKEFKDIQKQIALLYNTSDRTISRIIMNDYWCSKELGGGYKDWINYDKQLIYSQIKIELNKNTNEKMGEKDKRIAKLFNVSKTTVLRIRLGILNA